MSPPINLYTSHTLALALVLFSYKCLVDCISVFKHLYVLKHCRWITTLISNMSVHHVFKTEHNCVNLREIISYRLSVLNL